MGIQEIKISEVQGRFLVILTTKTGRIYHNDWAHRPTEEEVRSQWKTDRRWFKHIN